MRTIPYIITARRRCDCGGKPNAAGVLPGCISRRAVATLEEARTAAADVVCLSERHAQYTQGEAYSIARTLPESGGTVGPLPDGTVIEVEQIDPDVLAREAGFITVPGTWALEDLERICDAYNARQS